MKNSSSRIRGFSLIELMVVMLIIGIIAAFAVPAASNILRGSQMTQASQIMMDQISNARQIALTKNHSVEVRFIRFTDPETPNDVGSDGKVGNFRAIWVFELVESVQNGAVTLVPVPVDKPQLLPQAIVMSVDPALSPILVGQSNYLSPIEPLPTDPQTYPRSTNGQGTAYTYVPFRFNPDGSTNMLPQTTSWFITLQNINDKPTPGLPPPNFFTLLVDPVGGTVRVYRPGV